MISSKPPSTSVTERKRSSISKVPPAPSPPRRVSSKWHPSLIKPTKSRPPAPSPRSTSAERVRETRLLYSSWHREMVARSRERLSATSPTRPGTLGKPSDKNCSEVRNNFLNGRRAVSDSRFKLQDRSVSPIQRSSSNKSNQTVSRSSSLKENRPVTRYSHDYCSSLDRKLSDNYRKTSHSPRSTLSKSSRDESKKWSTVSADSNRRNIERHTVSSMNKCRRNEVTSLPPTLNGSIPKTVTPDKRKKKNISPERIISNISKKVAARKDGKYLSSNINESLLDAYDKRLQQSESFDTTQSNETGYSSMLDISSSPTPDRKAVVDQSERNKDPVLAQNPVNRPSIRSNISSVSKRKLDNRPHSAPAMRTRTSALFHERRNMWEATSKGESTSPRRSYSPTRASTPLRSLQLVKQVSSSFKNIPNDTNTENFQSKRSFSLERIGPSPHSQPWQYRQYILELRHAAPRNVRVTHLRHLFSSLDRAHNIERSISSAELTAADRRIDQLLDFETWKSLRETQRKAIEYNLLLKELSAAQKEREFLYKVTSEKKWSGDNRLRGRDISVNQLKERFDLMKTGKTELVDKKKQIMNESKDTYRGLWRGTSVRDLSNAMQSPDRGREKHKRGSSLSLYREDSGVRPRGLWTSLSLERVSSFREHLTEIYGSMQSVRSWKERRQLDSSRNKAKPQNNKEEINVSIDLAKTGRILAEKLSNVQLKPPSKLPNNSDVISIKSSNRSSSSEVSKIEVERRKLSKQLSIELQEKVAEQKSFRDKENIDSLSHNPDDSLKCISPDVMSRSSPRTCYSLDISDTSEPTSLSSQVGDQFMLVVQKPKNGNQHELSDHETSDSEISVRTVVHQDVAGKVKYFEKQARHHSRSSERQSPRSSHLSVDPSEVPHYATLPTRHKDKAQKRQKLLAPNYVPERSMSSVNLAQQNDVASEAWQMYQKTNSRSSLPHHQRSDGTHISRREYSSKNYQDTSYSRSYLVHVKTGDVNRLKSHYESPESQRRAKSLPNMGKSLSKVTPAGKTVVKRQEEGNVKGMRHKYENPKKSRSPEHWTPLRNEYLPKTKLPDTLESLASRSPSFYEPDTLARLSSRASVEKAVLRRVHTGAVEAAVEKLESGNQDKDISIMGQMYTSSPSLNELASLSTLIPPRPPPPIMASPDNAPKKPSRMVPSKQALGHPLYTSTPVPSPVNTKEAQRQRALQVCEPRTTLPSLISPPYSIRKSNFDVSKPYDVDAHKPKSRYTPPESYGASAWTTSLERPKRVTRAISRMQEVPPPVPPLRNPYASPPPRPPPYSPPYPYSHPQPYSSRPRSYSPTRMFAQTGACSPPLKSVSSQTSYQPRSHSQDQMPYKNTASHDSYCNTFPKHKSRYQTHFHQADHQQTKFSSTLPRQRDHTYNKAVTWKGG